MLYFYKILLLLYCTAPLVSKAQDVAISDVETMASTISGIFEIFMQNFTGHHYAQQLFDDALVTVEDVDGTVHASSVAVKIESTLQFYNNFMHDMEKVLIKNLKQRNHKKLNSSVLHNTVFRSEELQFYEGWSYNISLDKEAIWLPEHSWSAYDLLADISWSSTLQKLWSSAWKSPNVPDIHSLYFGGSSGAVRIFPGRQKSNGMDARSMSWFSGAASPQKDVVFVLDLSDSMKEDWLELKRGVRSVIHSLTSDDFMQIIITQNGHVKRFGCAASTGLTRATLDTKLEVFQWLDELEPRGKADLNRAVVELYDVFFEAIGDAENIGLLSNSSNCVKIAMLIAATPDAVTLNIENLIDSIDRELSVIIHSWIVGKAVAAAENYADDDFSHSSGGFYDASCSHSGVWTSSGKLSESLLKSYQWLAAGFTRSTPLWTLGFGGDFSLFSNESRATTHSTVLSASLPIYSPYEDYPVVLGVVGIDINFDSLLDILEKEEIGLSYAFLTSRFGETIVHPRAPNIEQFSLFNGPLFYDVVDIEPSFLENDVRKLLVQESSGNVSFIVNLPIPRGDTGEGFVVNKEPMYFFWRHVIDSPFIVVVALAEENRVKQIFQTSSPISQSMYPNAHLLQQYGQYNFLPPGFYFSITPELLALNIAGASFTHSSISATYHKHLFGDWQSFIQSIRDGDLDACRLAHLHLNSLPLTEAMIAESDLTKTELLNNPVFGNDVKRAVQLTAGMDNFWRQMEGLAFTSYFFAELRQCVAWSVVGTDPGGLLRTWPGFSQSLHDEDPVKIFWNLRARASPDLYALSQPVSTLSEDDNEEGGLGRVIAMSTVLYYNSLQKEKGVVGSIVTYFNYTHLYNTTLLRIGCPTDRLSRGGRQCLIIGPDGSMLMMPEFTSADAFTFLDETQKLPSDLLFLGDREAELADQLIQSGFLVLQEQLNFKTERVEYSYRVSSRQTYSGSLTMNTTAGYCTTASSVHVVPVEGTNFHLIVFDGYYFTDKNCTARTPPTSQPIEKDTCSFNSKNYARPQPECSIFRVSEDVLESKLRSTDNSQCKQSSNPEVVWIEWSDTAAIVMYSLTSLCVLVTLLVFILMIVYRKKDIIRFSTPLFVYFTLIGSFLAYAVILLSIGEPTTATCNLKLWFGVVSFILIFGCLAIKTLRIWAIMRSTLVLHVVKVSQKDILTYLAAIFVIPLIILIVWSALDPLQPIEYDDNVDDEKRTLRCGSDNDVTTLIFGTVLATYAAVIMIGSAYLSVALRNAPLYFNESKWMMAAIYNFILLLTTGVILQFILNGTPVASFLIFTVSILLAVFGVTAFVFMPKLYKVIFDPENSKLSTTPTLHSNSNSSVTRKKIEHLTDFSTTEEYN